MAKCGKGCMPECEYFTTGGCISPFNCPYKIETGYINSATSIPTYMGQYNGMSNDDIERCLERLATCKTTDVMNFDYAGTLAYIKRLKSENADLHARLKEAELRARLDRAVELPVRIGDPMWYVVKNAITPRIVSTSVTEITIYEDEIVVNLKNTPRRLVLDYNGEVIGNYYEIYLDKNSAEERLKELQGGER